MKTVIATIKPFKMDNVKEVLADLGLKGFRVIESKGFGGQGIHTEIYRGAEYSVSFLPKVDVVITVQDHEVDRLVQAILKVVRTGNRGDGRITVIPTEQFWNIRTGENEVEVGMAKVE